MTQGFKLPEGWKVSHWSEYGYVIIIRDLNPMPELSQGDWLLTDGGVYPDIVGANEEIFYMKQQHKIEEIRFADGRPNWRRR